MMSRDVLIEDAYTYAVAILQRCATPHGFRASGITPGYPQIWARDSVITGLGAALTGDAHLLAAFRASLDTWAPASRRWADSAERSSGDRGRLHRECRCRRRQSVVHPGPLLPLSAHGRSGLHGANWPRVEQAVLWLRYQDMNECGLLEVPEAGDWMDLLAVRYNVLYDNVLYGAALRAAATMAGVWAQVLAAARARRTTFSSGSICCCGSTVVGCPPISPSTWSG